ncbi:caspase recruitment domain-containing protein 10 [Pleurodeles waltl]|uniref:caspase recruitment domain-containing protein 10 n=1 Tax=Pleurodeles waltl TaxID=8319 RepID=UPI00370938FB
MKSGEEDVKEGEKGGLCMRTRGVRWEVGSAEASLASGHAGEGGGSTRNRGTKHVVQSDMEDAAGPECRTSKEEGEEEEKEENEMWEKIEGVRHQLTRSLNPAKLTPYLRQCRVIDEQDEEEVLNTYRFPTKTSQTGRLMDILRSRGKRGYISLLESLEFYYPEQFSRLTGQKPTQRCSMILDEEGPEGLTQFLMTELRVQRSQRRQRLVREQQLIAQCQALQEEKAKLERQVEELQGAQQHHSILMAERDRDLLELQRLKDENYTLALRYAQLSEEKNLAQLRSRDLQIQVDQLKCRMSSLEEECSLVRKRSIKLQNDLEKKSRGMDREAVISLQAENERLKGSLQEVQKALQSGEPSVPEAGKILLEILEQDRRDALEEQQEQSIKMHQLQDELHTAEQQRDKYLRDMEDLQLRQQGVQKECELYQQRMNTVLAQMVEVEKERDQAIKNRDQVQRQHDQSVLDKDCYRKQVRALEEERNATQARLTHLEALRSRLQGQLQRACGDQTPWGVVLSISNSWNQHNISTAHEDLGCISESSETPGKVTWASGKLAGRPQLEGRSKSLDLLGSFSSLDDIHSAESITTINRLSLMPFPPGPGTLLRRQQEDGHPTYMKSYSDDFGVFNVEQTGIVRNTPLYSSNTSPTSLFSIPTSCDSWTHRGVLSRQLTITFPAEDLSSIRGHIDQCVGDTISIVGGSHKGIYVKCVKPGSDAETAGLKEGCRLLKFGSSDLGPLSMEQCTKEVAHLYLQHCSDPAALTFRMDKEGYEALLQELNGCSQGQEDSFYVRANLDIQAPRDHQTLRVKSRDILHVINTMFQGQFEWFGARVDALTQMDLDRGTIPNYCRAQQILLCHDDHRITGQRQRILRYNKKSSPKVKDKLVDSKNNSASFTTSIDQVEQKLAPKPYSLLWPHRAQTCRPVIFSPRSLARGLIRSFLELPASSLDFDFCPSEILLEEESIASPEIIMSRSITPNQVECIRIRSIRDCIRKNKHCLLELGVSAVKELVRNNIFPIVIHIRATDKNLLRFQNLLQPPVLNPPDMLRKAHQEADALPSLPYPWACLEPKSSSHSEDLVKALRSLIFQEQPKLLWVEEDKLRVEEGESLPAQTI